MDKYELTAMEQKQVDEIQEQIAQFGSPVMVDPYGQPVINNGGMVPLEYAVLRSRRYLVDNEGVVWKYTAEGAPKSPGVSGTPRRNSVVEMWTGQWRVTKAEDGTVKYTKRILNRPIDEKIGGQPGMTKIQYYRIVKHYKHPFDPPHAPTEQQIRVMQGNAAVRATEVAARMETELTRDAGQDEDKRKIAEKLVASAKERVAELNAPRRRPGRPKKRTNVPCPSTDVQLTTPPASI